MMADGTTVAWLSTQAYFFKNRSLLRTHVFIHKTHFSETAQFDFRTALLKISMNVEKNDKTT